MKKVTFMRKAGSVALLVLALAGFALFFAHTARADDLSATASLADDTIEAGDQTELTLEITGATGGQVPKSIDAKGLTILYSSGPNVSVQFVNGVVTKSVSCTYTVQADHEGKYMIPAITVTTGGATLTTRPLTLTVTGGSGSAHSGGGAAGAPDSQAETKYAFAEIVVPGGNAYVGEAVPLEIRFYFDSRARFGGLNMPDVKSDGFTIQKLSQPRQEQIEKNGRNYTMVSFKTAVTPAKSGKLTLGPAELDCEAQLPVKRAAPRPSGRMDDFFNDNLFNQMMGVSPPQPLTVTSNSVDFEVKPLPLKGQPANFAGAVGQFTLATDASPRKVNVGDPITLKLKVSGRGNFDRVTAPVVTDSDGWRSYPPSGKFTEDDDVGISGTKAFEMAIIPNENKTTTPGVEFSYFDPVSEKYVTLRGDPVPITVEGHAPAPAAQPSAAPQTAAADAAKHTSDIQYIMSAPAHWGASFTPIFRRNIFWEAQAMPALALVAFAGVQAGRKKSRDLLARQQAARRREQGDLMRIMQRDSTEPAAFYDAATRYIQIGAARGSGRAPESIGAAEAIASHPLDAATGEGVQSIFNAHGELRYAGAGVGGRKLPDGRRREVLETLRKFQNARE